ncbi:MAG TPA: endonuclease/exonuclease/phosphatase family protein [Pirellulaceae bacterium]|nr:endonuclease/exonuclease/phosphatase family protein [Planctomycetaceae bacterium]HRX82361.1 endonuclease/exonuclease/phosphatase family protein [Pirellulaceae bacterium]
MVVRSIPTICIALLASLLLIDKLSADDPPRTRVRFATFNVSLNRPTSGRLIQDLNTPNNHQAQQIAEIIQRVRPDVLLLNEFDYDERGIAADRFVNNYLAIAQGKQAPIRFDYKYLAPVNTGVASGCDLDDDGNNDGPGDAFGFGVFPGQYGMLVLSRFPIKEEAVRTFQKFLWRDMPNALLPHTESKPFYDEAETAILRLSSKSHWDLPIQVAGRTIHLLCAHPTPPVFDGPEDRNGRRNHDEIRFWADYVVPDRSGYIYDDIKQKDGLPSDSAFVIAGDMNSDPFDGDSTNGAIDQLLSHPLIDSRLAPASKGATEKSMHDGAANRTQLGPPAQDTSDFNDRSVGNLRLDYVLPCKSLRVLEAGVFWPADGESGHELVEASDHRLTWIDIEM